MIIRVDKPESFHEKSCLDSAMLPPLVNSKEPSEKWTWSGLLVAVAMVVRCAFHSLVVTGMAGSCCGGRLRAALGPFLVFNLYKGTLFIVVYFIIQLILYIFLFYINIYICICIYVCCFVCRYFS